MGVRNAINMFGAMLGPLVMVGIGINYLSGYGSKWSFGGNGVPQSLIDRSQGTYLDGSSVDPFSMKLIESGSEPLALAVGALVLTVLIIGNILMIRSMNRSQAHLEESKRLMEWLQRRGK